MSEIGRDGDENRPDARENVGWKGACIGEWFLLDLDTGVLFLNFNTIIGEASWHR